MSLSISNVVNYVKEIIHNEILHQQYIVQYVRFVKRDWLKLFLTDFPWIIFTVLYEEKTCSSCLLLECECPSYCIHSLWMCLHAPFFKDANKWLGWLETGTKKEKKYLLFGFFV